MRKRRAPGPEQVWAECRERLRHLRLRGDVEAYADGELTGARRAMVAGHIARCWACSGSLQLLQLVKASLRRTPGRAPVSLASARLRRYAGRIADAGPAGPAGPGGPAR
ncbi:zf-HC2 domain-containing protein [Streptomyces tirandamycinicus]|uniref:zf-HC2 domain-containing protein n=1 Tax=Streptomyces tirandamycinicus TaxID=2174846 RepID=UPI00342C5217